MACDSCGRDLPPDARFCPGCGTAVADRLGDGEPEPATAAEPEPGGEAEAEPQPEPEDEAEASDAEPGDEPDDEQDAPTSEAPPGEARRKTRPSPATILGNVLAVAAGGTLGVLVGLAIRQAM